MIMLFIISNPTWSPGLEKSDRGLLNQAHQPSMIVAHLSIDIIEVERTTKLAVVVVAVVVVALFVYSRTQTSVWFINCLFVCQS